MYATFAKEAKEEGFDRIAYLFEMVGKIEKEHEERYRRLLENVENGLVSVSYTHLDVYKRQGGTEAVQGLGQTLKMAFLGEEAPAAQSYLQKTQQLFREDMDGVEAVVNDILYGIGEMLPAVAVGIATGGAGVPAAVGSAVSSLVTAGTSFGSTYSQARREGKEAGEAASYALLTAASEAALQYGFSGVKALGGSALSRTLGKKLDGVLGKLASGNLGQRFAGMVLKNIGQNGGEFVEEYLQSVMTPFLRNAAFGENNEVSFLSEDAL